MNRKTHVYGWDNEPVDERPSELPSTGFSVLSGYHSMREPGRSQRPEPRSGIKSLVVRALLLALTIWAGLRLVAWCFA